MRKYKLLEKNNKIAHEVNTPTNTPLIKQTILCFGCEKFLLFQCIKMMQLICLYQ